MKNPKTTYDKRGNQWQKVGKDYIKHSDLPEKMPSYLTPTKPKSK